MPANRIPHQVDRQEASIYVQVDLEWIRLANRNNPAAHIPGSYRSDAVYFSNGRRSTGPDQIIRRYGYMANPDYQVDLQARRLQPTSGDRVPEIGRYFTGPRRSGSGGLYVILWERRENDDWKIAFDFNF